MVDSVDRIERKVPFRPFSAETIDETEGEHKIPLDDLDCVGTAATLHGNNCDEANDSAQNPHSKKETGTGATGEMNVDRLQRETNRGDTGLGPPAGRINPRRFWRGNLKARLHIRFSMRFWCDFDAILRTKPAPAYPARVYSRVTLRQNTAKLAEIRKKAVFK